MKFQELKDLCDWSIVIDKVRELSQCKVTGFYSKCSGTPLGDLYREGNRLNLYIFGRFMLPSKWKERESADIEAERLV